MSAFFKKLDDFLPFNKTERIIIGIVLLLHALPALEFLHFSQRPPQMDDERVMANLVSPEASKTQQPPAAKQPKQKKEQKQQDPPKQSPQNSSDTTNGLAQDGPAKTSQANNETTARKEINYGQLIEDFTPNFDAYYPSFSKRAGEAGVVTIRLFINKDGSVESCEMVKSSGFPKLDRAALQIGNRFRYKTVLTDGSPLSNVSATYGIQFKLRD